MNFLQQGKISRSLPTSLALQGKSQSRQAKEESKMKQIKKILFPINFADKYWVYIPWVSTLTQLTDATLYLLYVTQDLEEIASLYAPPESIQRFKEKAIRAGQERMEIAVREFFKEF